MSVIVNEHAMGLGRSQSQSYERDIEQTLHKVADLVTFVEGVHFDQSTLLLFWRNEKRALLTVQTIGRLLGRPLYEELQTIRDLLERALPYDLPQFSATVTPQLFEAINELRPSTGTLDERAAVEQHHYAADVRQATLQHVLTTLNQRYQTPRFRDLNEASRWTEAYSSNLQAAEVVIQDTRTLLKHEVEAAKAYLRQISRDIEAIETAAEEKLGIVKRIRWVNSLEEAEHTIHNHLAERAAQMEGVTFAIFTETKSPGFLEMVARHAISKAPKLGSMLLLGLAGTGATVALHGVTKPQVSPLTLPQLPQPVRGTTNPEDTARFVALREGTLGSRTGSHLPGAVQRLVTNVQARNRTTNQGEQTREKVDQLFGSPTTTTTRQTVVLHNPQELRDLISRLTPYGYREEDILSLLKLPSVESLTQPLTLDIREGRERPMLFPRSAAVDVTAPQQVLPQVNALYRVQSGDALSTIAERFGVSTEQLAQANPGLVNPQQVMMGQLLTIPGRIAPATAEQLQRGDTLERVAQLFNVPMQDLATLNQITQPTTWRFQGGLLNVPVPTLTGGAGATLIGAQVQSGAGVVVGEEHTAPRLAVLPGAGDAYIVYRVQPSETLFDIAARYGIAVSELAADNNLTSEIVTRGQHLLLRRPGVPVAQPETPAPVISELRNPQFESAGSFGSANEAASPADSTRPAEAGHHEVVARYGDTLFTDLEQMPPDARTYFVETIQEVATFFEVRPGDVMGILRLEQNNAGWRLQEPRVSSAGAQGVGQIVARTWNGWANPEHDQYVPNVLDIEEHGGLGFDWSKREAWRAWKSGQAERDVLVDSNADPAIFENSVAGVARHLVHWGLTRDFAERDPAAFADRLADAIAVYNSGRTLDESAEWVQSADNPKTTAQYVAEAMATSEEVSAIVEQPSITVAAPDAAERYTATFKGLYDQSFGVALSDAELEQTLAVNAVLLEDVRLGKVTPEIAASQLLEQVELGYMAEGRSAIQAGRERPWPFIHNAETLYAQKSAASLLGRTLTLYEVDDLMNRTLADRDAIRVDLMGRADARLFMQSKHVFDQMLERTARGLPVYTSEVAQLVHPLLAGHSPITIDDQTLQQLAEQMQGAIEGLDEYKQIHGSYKFDATPLLPMPSVFKGFGAPVDYQVGGRHTGLDVSNPRTSEGEEPAIYAVADATVAHVGPLYCETADACRGGRAIVLDHGNNVYSIYSHNSEATVASGDQVQAGQQIGRQGDEGFSYGSHLHFEVHTGAPFTGDWERPFTEGQFVDPAPWLPH